jgi:hypothetical protein
MGGDHESTSTHSEGDTRNRREDAPGYFTTKTLPQLKARRLALQKKRDAKLAEVARLNYFLDRYARAVGRAFAKVLAEKG